MPLCRYERSGLGSLRPVRLMLPSGAAYFWREIMRYTVNATNGRNSMEGTTTLAMWQLLKAGQTAGRDFIEPWWEELVRSTIFETAHWAGHGTTERSHSVATSPLTKEWRVVATGGGLGHFAGD